MSFIPKLSAEERDRIQKEVLLPGPFDNLDDHNEHLTPYERASRLALEDAAFDGQPPVTPVIRKPKKEKRR
jgi:hypothetical protein